MAADPSQPAKNVRQVAAEDAAIGMQLVDDDIPEILEELGPSRVVRKDPRMNHVGVAEHDVCAASDGPPGVLRRIAVIGKHADRRVVR